MPDRCDMKVGPCACGAWHGSGDFQPMGFNNDDPRTLDPIFLERILYDLEWLRNGESRPADGSPEPLVAVSDPRHAVLASSRINQHHAAVASEESLTNQHMPCFDMDFRFGTVKVIESASGNTHLYMNVPMTWEQVCILLDAFQAAGLVQPGYVTACKQQQMTRLRMPGVPKIPARWVGYQE